VLVSILSTYAAREVWQLEDDFINRELSRVHLQIQKSRDTKRLHAELNSILTEDFRRLFNRAATKNKALIENIFEMGDSLTIAGESSNEMLLIIANVGGGDPFASFASFAFLDSVKPGKSVTVTPRVDSNFWKEGPDGGFKILERFCAKRRVNMLTVMRDGLLNFDGFYVSVPREMKGDLLAQKLVDFVEGQGHSIGKYSVRADSPTYSIVATDNELMARLVGGGKKVYGLTISEDINGGRDALHYLRMEHSRMSD
jgi:hypothetical protein